MDRLQNQVVTFESFLVKVEKEAEYMQSATDYRRKTANMALDFVKNFHTVDLFESRDRAYKTLKTYFNMEDDERLLDVAKFLNVLYKELEKFATLPEQVRALLAEKAKNRKPLSLVPVN